MKEPLKVDVGYYHDFMGEFGESAGIDVAAEHDVTNSHMPSGFTFLAQSKVWVFRLPGTQFHLRPDGHITTVVEL